jgi:saccharopine dehydrogenase-like NADP-dependent oxidoreductase
MKRILILGAGLSSSSLIKYLLDNASKHDWKVIVADVNYELAVSKIEGNERGKALAFDLFDEQKRSTEIQKSDIVISMLPARFHYLIAKDCVKYGVDMVTASYVSPEIKALDEKAKTKNIILLNEIGVDPGIDHMSAMQIIDKIRAKGGKLYNFESSTGGLVAPEYDNNPWNYKFTWNPRNVILAGQGVSQFLHNGRFKYIPYHKLFSRTEDLNILDLGAFEIYPNRDSLKYREIYGLENIQTMFRGTIRRKGFSEAWNVFVQLGLTDDTYIIEDSKNITYRKFINSFLPYDKGMKVETKISNILGIAEDSEIMEKIKWTGIFDEEVIGLEKATPAQILQHLLTLKWKLDPEDKDMIVMHHIFDYEYKGDNKHLTSTMVVKGTDQVYTAMSITVGIPAAIATKLILTGKITRKGVQVPIVKDIYEPVMEELDAYGVKFIEKEVNFKSY